MVGRVGGEVCEAHMRQRRRASVAIGVNNEVVSSSAGRDEASEETRTQQVLRA